MKTRRMGRTGLKVSEICLGTMTFGHQCDPARVRFAIMDKAAEGGVNFIDAADVYPVPPSPETWGRTEEIVGAWLEGKRDQFVLATKCRIRVGHGPNDEGLSRRLHYESGGRQFAAVAHRLHRPVSIALARSGDALRRTLRAFDDLGAPGQGTLRWLLQSRGVAVGVGVWASVSGWTWHAMTASSLRYNLLYRDIEAELLPLCRDQGVGGDRVQSAGRRFSQRQISNA